ncbi:MAG: carboxypeptidase-like regulatory domain-containing protein, partial [Bacteroidota bacterium]
MRYTYTLLLFWTASCCLLAQVCVEGQVLDALTGEPLPWANILLVGTNQGEVSDIYGQFKLCASIAEQDGYTLE